MAEKGGDSKLSRLEAKIEAAKARRAPPKSEAESHHSAIQRGWRMVIELVSGVLIGMGMGYGLDALFGTMPIMTIIFCGFGFAAGVKTMLRTAAEAGAEGANAEAAKK